MRGITSRLSYSNVMATVAVFVALGGSSYAAVRLSKNSVTSRAIAPNAVTSSKVKNGSLLLRDFKSSEATKLKGATGATGAQGAQGPQGVPGPTAGGYAANAGVVGPLTTTPVKVVSLAANGTGAITPSFNGRLLVTATGNAHSGNVTNSDAFCDIRVSTNGGAYNQIGVANSYGVELPTQFNNVGTTVTAGTDVTAGSTYDAAMYCLNFNGTTTIDRSQLTAVVVAR